MILAILSHTPVWVWALLAALLALGWLQTRPRRVTPARLLALPLALLGLGLASSAGFFVALPLAGAAWLLALAAGVALLAGRPPRAGTEWLPAEQRLRLPGSWVPMLLIVAIFSLRYAANVGLAINPQWRTTPQVLLPLSMLYGALSGLFLGRAWSLLRLVRRPAPLQLAAGDA